MKYRFGGKEKRISLGVYPDVLLKEARRRRSQARQLLAREIDPSEHRKAQKAARPERSANSFEAVAREWFLKHSPHWATSYSGRMLRRLERDIFPWIGDKPIAVIRAPELLASGAPDRTTGSYGNGPPGSSDLRTGVALLQWPRDEPSATQLEICGVRCPRSRERTLRPSPSPSRSAPC